jgi:hypothetical protein
VFFVFFISIHWRRERGCSRTVMTLTC